MRVRGYAAGMPCWAAVSGPDPSAQHHFYRALFDWELNEGQYLLEGRVVAGQGAPQETARWIVSVTVDDTDSITKTVEQHGGAVVMAPVTAEQGTAAMFTDPTGATFATWQRHGRFAGAQVSYEPGAVCWFELAAHDPSAADDFYNEVFGWRVLEAESPPGDPMFEFRHHGDTVGGLVPIDHRFPQRDIASHWTVCFMVDNHDETAERVANLGGTVLRQPMQTPTGWYTRVRDPLGAHFGIIELSDQFRID